MYERGVSHTMSYSVNRVSDSMKMFKINVQNIVALDIIQL